MLTADHILRWHLPEEAVEVTSDKLGKGSYGAVYRGLLKSKEGEAPRSVAVKVVDYSPGSYESIHQFHLAAQKECDVLQLTTGLDETVRLVGVTWISLTRVRIVMELLPATLKDLLKEIQEQVLDDGAREAQGRRRRSLAIQCVDLLGVLYKMKCIHGDIKANNLFIRYERVGVQVGGKYLHVAPKSRWCWVTLEGPLT